MNISVGTYASTRSWRKLGYGLCRGLVLFCICALGMAVCACHRNKKEEPQPPTENSQTILVYMVASNSLSDNVEPDIAEMKWALQDIDMTNKHVALFISDIKSTQKLYELRKADDGSIVRQEVLAYDDTKFAVDPERMSAVIADVQRLMPANDYGLVLWSHATAWNYAQRAPMQRSFGDDFGHHMNIDKLADALPEHLFSFIWMDCCYMSNIECIYQLRNKCRYYIAYPTEVLADGMNYGVTLPHLLQADGPDVCSAATAMYLDYANNAVASNRACTIAVVDMDAIPQVAAEVNKLYKNYTYNNPYGVQMYSRGKTGPFYDLVQYTSLVANGADMSGLKQAMERAVIYKAATPTFLGLFIDTNNFSGISTHAYVGDDSVQEDFYRTLDWYDAVFP